MREFAHGHALQRAAVLRRHLVALAQRTPLLAGLEQRCFIDIDSLLRPVYGKAKQGASFGHTKIAGKTVLRRGLSPLAVTQRPAEVADRLTLGHLEGDLILGRGNRSAIATLVERATGATMLVALPDGYKAEQVRQAFDRSAVAAAGAAAPVVDLGPGAGDA